MARTSPEGDDGGVTVSLRPLRHGERRSRLAGLVRDPIAWAGLVQNAKIVLAAVLAWVVAIDVLGLSHPILAPWSAVLVVHATVYRTFARGAQQVTATVLAVVLAWSVGHVLGIGAVSLGVTLTLAFAIGRFRWLRDESTTLATTAIVVLGTGFLSEANLFFGRLADTLVGIGVGLLVNLLVWPPLRDRGAAAFVTEIAHEIGDVLTEIASGLGLDLDQDQVEEWLRMCREVDVHHDRAWGLVRQARESTRLNPRQRARRSRVSDLEDVLHCLEQAVSEVESMLRTLALSAESANAWEDGFRGRWAGLLEDSAAAIGADDPERLENVRTGLQALAQDLSNDDLRAGHWAEYGGLILNLRNVVTSMQPVAEWHQARVGPAPAPDVAGATGS
jgi:uncharacterized membrane protein YgaE (UPF0421/DUF939 family)